MSKNKNTQKEKKSKSSNTKKTENKKTKSSYSPSLNDTLSMHEKFTNLYVIGMFTLFPVFMTDKLFNLRKDRLHYFIGTTIVLLFFIIAFSHLNDSLCNLSLVYQTFSNLKSL